MRFWLRNILLAAPLIWLSAEALACPDLSGSYTCIDPENRSLETLVSQQQHVNGVWEFTLKEEAWGKDEGPIVADGKFRENPLNEHSPRRDSLTKGRFWCSGDRLIGEIQSGPKDVTDKSWSFHYTISLSLDDQGGLMTRLDGQAQVPDYEFDERLEFSQTCSRNH